MTELDPRLEQRLRGLAEPALEGDWLDVRRRARRSSARTLALAAAAMLLLAVPAIAVGGRLLDVLGIRASEERIPAPVTAPVPPYIHGDRLYGLGGGPRHLAKPLFAPLLGQEEALAVQSPDGRYVLYHAWDGKVRGDGTPVLRVFDLRRWTEVHGEYVVIAWAGDALLVEARPGPGYHRSEDIPGGKPGPDPGIYVLTGPGTLRRLPLSGVVALSPDGRRVLGWWREGDGASLGARLVEIDDGRIVASSTLLRPYRGGAWAGDRVVVSLGPSANRLAIVRPTGGEIVVERELRLEADEALRARYGPFLTTPVFTSGGRAVVVRLTAIRADDSFSFAGFLTCELDARSCVRGRNLQPATTWAGLIDNPSRPQPR